MKKNIKNYSELMELKKDPFKKNNNDVMPKKNTGIYYTFSKN